MPGNGPRLQQTIVFLFALGVVGLAYLGCAWMLRVPELSNVLDELWRRAPRWRRLVNPARD
jgi:hypothetical protein